MYLLPIRDGNAHLLEEDGEERADEEAEAWWLIWLYLSLAYLAKASARQRLQLRPAQEAGA